MGNASPGDAPFRCKNVNIPMTIGNSTVSALNIYCKYVRVKNAMCHLCFALQGK